MNHAAVIIVAAGTSRRMGFNKLTALLGGEPVLRRTLGVFEVCPEVAEIVLVTSPEMQVVVEGWNLPKVIRIVPGGSERQFSVKAGLDAVSPDCDVIAIHDGARPLVSVAQVSRCIAAARQLAAVTCARRVTETLKRTDADGRIVGSIERDNAWIMETPQVFRREVIQGAYARVLQDGCTVTDEVSAVQHAGGVVHVVENLEPNPKITVPGDLLMAERLLS